MKETTKKNKTFNINKINDSIILKNDLLIDEKKDTKAIKEITKIIKNLDIVKDLNFNDNEIKSNRLLLQSYLINKNVCEKSENCNVSHFDFYRDENNKINIKLCLCPKKKIYKKINDIFVYHNNKDSVLFQNLMNVLIQNDISNLKVSKLYKELSKEMINFNNKNQNFFFNFDFEKLEEKNNLVIYFIWKIFSKNENKKIGYCDLRILLNNLKFNFENNEYINNSLKELKEVDVLIIDNLGTELVQKNLQDVYFYDVLNNFFTEKKEIYFFSTKDINELSNYYKTIKNFNFDNINNIVKLIKMLIGKNFLSDKNNNE